MRGAGAAATAPAASQPATPQGVIGKVTGEALEVLRDGSLSKAQKRARVRQIAYASMDFETLARLALGPPWRILTAAQKKDYLDAFRTHMAATYGHTVDQYTNEDIKVMKDYDEPDGDHTVVTSVLGTKDGVRQEVAKVNYRLRKREGEWKIIDVIIDGVSLVANFRAQFEEIMGQGGIEQVIKMLREKNAAGDPEAGGTGGAGQK